MEPRVITRIDAMKYAREAYNLGVRIIGGCCGFVSYHIRAILEELHEDIDRPLPPSSTKAGHLADALKLSVIPEVRARYETEKDIRYCLTIS